MIGTYSLMEKHATLNCSEKEIKLSIAQMNTISLLMVPLEDVITSAKTVEIKNSNHPDVTLTFYKTMITIYVLQFAYQTTNSDVADAFVRLVESLGFEVSTEITQSTKIIDGIQKVA